MFSPKKPSKLSPVKPQTPVEKPKTKQNKIHPDIPTGQLGQAQIVANKELGLPDKFLAIYYVDLIYDTIKELSVVILDLIKDLGKKTYIYPPIFKEDAVSKLNDLIKFIDDDRYMYLSRDIKDTKKMDIIVKYLFIKYLIKKPQDRVLFLEMMKDIKKAQGNSKIAIDLYANEINSYNRQDLERVIYWQYKGLTRKIIYFAVDINNRGVNDKLQSLKDVMAKFIDIINNILNDNDDSSYIEHPSLFSGGYILFPNLRYNKDDKKYTLLVNRYIDANANNFKNIYENFQTIYKYFKKINKRMANRYTKEFKKVVVPVIKYEKHPEYNRNSVSKAIATYPTLTQRTAIDTLNTNRAISMVEKQLKQINNDAAVKLFQIQLNIMSKIIEKAQEETDNLYHRLD